MDRVFLRFCEKKALVSRIHCSGHLCILGTRKSVNRSMQSKSFENEFLKNLELLSKEEQDNALAYIKSLPTRRQSQSEPLQFAGSLNAKSIREMTEAIEAGCETIGKNSW